jgi:hypothetical protein
MCYLFPVSIAVHNHWTWREWCSSEDSVMLAWWCCHQKYLELAILHLVACTVQQIIEPRLSLWHSIPGTFNSSPEINITWCEGNQVTQSQKDSLRWQFPRQRLAFQVQPSLIISVQTSYLWIYTTEQYSQDNHKREDESSQALKASSRCYYYHSIDDGILKRPNPKRSPLRCFPGPFRRPRAPTTQSLRPPFLSAAVDPKLAY